MPNSFQAGIARHLAAATPLPPHKAAIIVAHCNWMLQERGHLYDFEQALLLRVARFPQSAEPEPLRLGHA